MGGGSHNRADVGSAPPKPNHARQTVIGGGSHIRAVVGSAPHHEIEPDPFVQS